MVKNKKSLLKKASYAQKKRMYGLKYFPHLLSSDCWAEEAASLLFW